MRPCPLGCTERRAILEFKTDKGQGWFGRDLHIDGLLPGKTVRAVVKVEFDGPRASVASSLKRVEQVFAARPRHVDDLQGGGDAPTGGEFKRWREVEVNVASVFQRIPHADAGVRA